jgi:hypothetical protein
MVDQANEWRETNWQDACEAAERETDPVKLVQLLTTIEESIFKRLQELGSKDDQERAAVDRALAVLHRLQAERLKYPSWDGEEF